jgi:2-amino-4-hydroxy-6-hydroxymethyldihydropteridine diphosphokinase
MDAGGGERTVMILVAIGSNLPDPEAGRPTPLSVCEAAAGALRDLPGLSVERVSRWYRSAPVPVSDQPDYVNGVARLSGAIEPATLLAALGEIEQQFGRRRGVPNAARTLDLDIVAMGATVRDAPDPILPHPRAGLRAFVLLPLREVAPDYVDPRSGLSVDRLIDALPAGDRGSAMPIG